MTNNNDVVIKALQKLLDETEKLPITDDWDSGYLYGVIRAIDVALSSTGH